MLTDEQLAPIKAALQRKNKIEAIKQYRELTRVGLAEAKHAVEQIEMGAPPPPVSSPLAAPQPNANPTIEAKVPAGLGCVILLLVLAAGYFGINSIMASSKGQEDMASRYGRAMGMILCIWLTVSATLNAQNPQRRTMSVFMWLAILVILSVLVRQAIWL